MKSLFYDTETTGLPDWSKPSEDPCQPRVTQIASELVDDDTREVVAAMHCIIKPFGWVIPPDLEKLTGITTEKAEVVGLNMNIAIAQFLNMWRLADQRVAHNESFDMRMIRIEIMRSVLGQDGTLADDWKAGKAFCTQANSQKIINLPPTERMIASGRRGPKPPNLGEAYQHFTGQPLVNAHNATVDVAACKAVYFGIKNYQPKEQQ